MTPRPGRHLLLESLAFAGLVLLPLLAAGPGAAQGVSGGEPLTKASGRCGVCHPRDRVAFERSAHAREDVHCTSCHGGNDQADNEQAAHSGSWRGKPSRQEIPKLCGSCHSDARRMQPYDLPTDQYALYQTSAHGRKLAQGDPRVAVCSDCHGPHEILPPSDPASRVYVTNIPRTCGGCHGDSALVRARGIKDTYHEYLSSVHASQLLDGGNLHAPTCISCHGVHGAAPPEVGDVNKVCGRCHTAERRYFLAGPHASGMSRKALAECSSCHGDHATQASNTDNLAASCLQCHARGSAVAQLGDSLLADYRSAAHEIEEAETWVARADAVPIATDDFKARVAEARTYLREAMTAAHAVKPEVMASFTVRARSTGTEVSDEIQHELKNIRVDKLALLIFWFYVLVTVGILRRFRNARSQDT
jgi:hypothetical protein